MDPITLPLIVVSSVLALLAFIGKRWLDKLDQKIEKLEDEITQLKLKHEKNDGKIELALQLVQRIEDKL